jgi:predicted ester cyclase
LPPTDTTAITRYYDELWSAGDFSDVSSIVHLDYRGYDPIVDAAVEGPGGVEEQVMLMRGAFPDLTFTIEQRVSEGDWVAVRWRATGTHEGMFLGVRATHRVIDGAGISMFRLADGLLIEGWLQRDILALLRAIAPDQFNDFVNELTSRATSELG